MLAAGNHSEARGAAAEAAAARGAALRAHAHAAAAIERANNQARALPAGTLDLHGLHIGEALDALERRHALVCLPVFDIGVLGKKVWAWVGMACTLVTRPERRHVCNCMLFGRSLHVQTPWMNGLGLHRGAGRAWERRRVCSPGLMMVCGTQTDGLPILKHLSC